ncbi:MAG: hypothetical protein CMO55_25335 [Verrucomicrobiales bacterium]|nr:hypothetical protein [Verrucomicrobiales bacterium]
MFENLPNLPLPFWISGLLILAVATHFWNRRRTAYGFPALAVIGTVAVWYVGDALYNDYSLYQTVFLPETLASAWWQVTLFLLAFVLLIPLVGSAMNRSFLTRGSSVVSLISRNQIETAKFQTALTRFHWVLLFAWTCLMALALVRVNFDFKGLFFPWMGYKREPWGRDRIGGGFDALLSLAQYFQIFLTAAFGVIAALSKNAKTRYTALLVCFLAMPYFIFDRTRNTMLATVMPGVLAWIFIRLKGGLPVKAAVLICAFLVTEFWFGFVMENRTNRSIASAFAQRDDSSRRDHEHLGLNMFEELTWVNHFIEEGTYTPNWGQRYFAEAVNPIPRALWPNKPLIGIDYAIARGQGGGRGSAAGVHATISTGMIGQGVVNFGRFFGPIAAALLMAIWVAVLARQDLLGHNEPARLLLYGLGLILTFNMGRDITLLVLYPFLFGLILYLGWKRFFLHPSQEPQRPQPTKLPPNTTPS